MTPEAFRAEAHALVDWMADYLATVGTRRVLPAVAPGEIRARLPAAPPETPEPFAALRADFEAIILPGMMHWNHPGFFGYFPANHSPASILAEMVTATLGAQCMSWQTSPAATELEQVTMDWLRQLLGLPATFTGVIQDTASSATLVALLCARERATGFAAERDGVANEDVARRLVVYASAERHSSVDKAVRLAGYGLGRLRLVPTDARFAMRPDALAAMLDADAARGLVPAAIVATVGTTSSTACDPLEPIGALAARHGAWFHVDAAYGGAVALLPERRALFDGVARADSFVMNPHKWLLVNFDCSAYFVRDVPTLLRVCSTSPAYLRTSQDAAVANFRDWGIPLGRRFRALKLWWVLRSHGAEALREMLRRHLALAEEAAAWIAADPRFEVVAPVTMGLVCFRLRPRDGEDEAAAERRNRALLERVNTSGEVFLIATQLGARYVLRLAVGQRTTERVHVARAWALLRAGADAV